MNLSVGIVGLPNVGKSTLFNALLKRQLAQTAPYPFTTIKSNKGIVYVPDERLSKVADIARIEKRTPAIVEFIDIAGLVKEAHKGEGLGNQFLGHIRGVAIILHVIRGFKDDSVTHIYETIDSKRDLEIVNTELLLADLASLDKALDLHQKDLKLVQFLTKIKESLNKGNLVNFSTFSDEEKGYFRQFPLLSTKPQIVVINVDEKNMGKTAPKINNIEVLTLSAKFEEDLMQLSTLEQREFLQSYNLKESGIDQIIKKCFEKLNLITFYTIAKGNEARAWSIPKGSVVVEAAEMLHTDFEKNFIKADIIPFDEFVKANGWVSAREQGKVQTVGRDYIMKNGDVVEFKVGV